MFEDRTYTRTFYSAPQSVTSFVAAFLEPAITVACFLAIMQYYDQLVDGAAMTLCLLVFALSFPGRNRFKDPNLTAIVDIATSWVSLLAILALCGYATRSLDQFDEEVLVAWAVFTPLVQWAAVAAGREIVKINARKPEARRSAIVVGAGPLGLKVSKALEGHEGFGVDFLGFFDDRTDMRVHQDASDKVIGRLSEVSSYVMEHGVKEVYVTLPLTSQPRIKTLLESLQETTASLFFVPDVFGISIIQGRLQDVNGVPVVGILETPFTGTNAMVKRISDIVLASIILVLISPLLLLLAIGVKLSSPGPVIFRQRRYGLYGEEIMVYKFRSMTVTENGDTVTQARREDPRVTRVGAVLRRTSLDELPQFINVLQGKMSIVGPRPHAVAHNEQYRKLIKGYMLRHKVRPGITGWAQVSGFRGETDTLEKMERRVAYDLDYLRNWSLWLDLKIICKTVAMVLRDRNAF